ncbi:GNAT acetyltransferase [Candidatus Rubidus massiliensis]|nr:GNAT acetyltransferase [Candidatus Rubidus massiliensis]
MNRVIENKTNLQILHCQEYILAKPFYQNLTINEAILHAILENKSAGKVFTDNKIAPSFMLTCSFAGYVFLGGSPNLTNLENIISFLKTLSYVSLICPLNWEYQKLFVEAGFIPTNRIQLKRPNSSFHIKFWKQTIPNDYSFEKIDNTTFPKCNWYSFICDFYGDSKRFYNNGVGFSLTYKENLISESYCLSSSKKCEIGIATHIDYRGRNLGTITSALAVDHCYKKNLEPIWSCNVDNPASAGIAKKLGFQEDCRYYFLKWGSHSY